MERVRYVGSDKARDVALPGGSILCERMKWVDLEARAADAGIAAYHVAIIRDGLVAQEDWEAEGPVKAARTRKQNAATADVEPAAPAADEENDQ